MEQAANNGNDDGYIAKHSSGSTGYWVSDLP